ncbi:hypothetical protein CPLU01_00813 [Colletotrichum plurivorum]|uniref:Extracellular mutant protein 11 C-terminal domain-containing protein n=1 Tax=Colletotrichum plurivorum TaxID=2175906 RepID=A0A8H6NQS6_9PEZI|nr:hypothetical protein CPLU01_00813 [Colletotrichum plurivorum]
MVPGMGPNKMAQYARNASLDPDHPNGNANAHKNQSSQEPPESTHTLPQTRQAITESAKLPSSRAFASGHSQHTTERLPNPPSKFPGTSPPSQHRPRANSQSSDDTHFWPESHIDSQLSSPTTQRFEGYDAAIIHRTRSPHILDSLPLHPIDQRQPFLVGKNGMLRNGPTASGTGLPIATTSMPSSLLEPAAQPDTYPTKPAFYSPRRPVKLGLHNMTVKRSHAHPTHTNSQDVFAESPTRHMFSHNLRRAKRDGNVQQLHYPDIFQDDNGVEDSLVSNESVSEDNHGTPKATYKEAHAGARDVLKSKLPAFTREQRDKTRKRRRESCDYADEELVGMAYSKLREQPFDDDPAKKQQVVGSLAGDGLPAKLEHFKGQSEDEQRHLFVHMSVSDWERTGDWFLEQFGQVAKKLQEARRSKRIMIEGFETEIAKREESVRIRTESITQKLVKIKQKGEDMLADKEI